MMIVLTIFWLLLPILATSLRCINGGEWVAHDCTMDAQCEPYKIKPTDRVHVLARNAAQCHVQIMVPLTGKRCGTSYDCLRQQKKLHVPQQCPYNGEVIGLECNTSQSCQYLAPGTPVLCIQH
uniref:8.9 kDa family member n=1 Tax=Loa loa TaxID=7209 RepID=A0A1I7VV93_LOALO